MSISMNTKISTTKSGTQPTLQEQVSTPKTCTYYCHYYDLPLFVY